MHDKIKEVWAFLLISLMHKMVSFEKEAETEGQSLTSA